jgi:hypothetical protein
VLRLVPALQERRRLHLDPGAVGRDGIERGPLVADAGDVDPEGQRDDVLGEDVARGVADQVGSAPLPEAAEVEGEVGGVLAEGLVSGLAPRRRSLLDRRSS